MKKLLLLLACAPFLGHCDTWNPTPPGEIQGSQPTSRDIFSSANPATGKFLITWVNGSATLNDVPNYAIFDGVSSSWSVPATQIPMSQQAREDVFSSFDISSNTFLVTWVNYNFQDTTLDIPIFATYNGGTWSVPTAIPMSSPVSNSVYSSSNSSGLFLATWQNNSDGLPYYATFNGTSWNTPAAIPGTAQSVSNVYSSFSVALGKFLVTWQNNSDGNPYYATFDGVSTWTGPALIANIPANMGSDIFSSVNSTTGAFLVAWISSAFIPTYTTYDGMTWAPPLPITTSPANPYVSAHTSFSPNSGKFLVTLVQPDFTIRYSTYDGAAWSPLAPIPQSNTVGSDLFSSFSPAADKFLLTWVDSSTGLGQPLYDTLTLVSPTKTVLHSAPNPSKVLERVSFNARVTSNSLIVPTGTVTFRAGGKILGRAMLNRKGVASIKTCLLGRGVFPVTATYGGDKNFTGSTSNVVIQKVR